MSVNTEASIEALYVGYFGRAAEPDGFHYWNYQVEQGHVTLAEAAASFSVQPEATSLYPFLAGTSTDASSFIDQVYSNLFNRTPDAEGKAYWLDHLSHGGPSSVGDFILNVISGAQGDDLSTLNNKVEAATHFTTSVENSGIETTHFVDGHLELTTDASAAAHDVVDHEVTSDHSTVATSDSETSAFIDSHTVHDVHTVTVTVPGLTVYVPTEPTHDLGLTVDGTLPLSSTLDYSGTEMGFGSGNLPTHYAFLVDDTAGELMGLKAHFRTGDDVAGTAGTNGVDVVWNMPAGAQDGTIGSESGANVNRSHASIDLVLDNGVGLPHDGEYLFKIDNDPTGAVNYQTLTLHTDGAGNWGFLNAAGTDGQGMTVSNGGHVLADSFNLGFGFADMPHGPSGTGDVLPGTYDVELVHLVGGAEVATLHAQMVLA